MILVQVDHDTSLYKIMFRKKIVVPSSKVSVCLCVCRMYYACVRGYACKLVRMFVHACLRACTFPFSYLMRK